MPQGLIGASRSEPHTSESIEIFSICMYICAVRPTVYIPILILRPSKLLFSTCSACVRTYYTIQCTSRVHRVVQTGQLNKSCLKFEKRLAMECSSSTSIKRPRVLRSRQGTLASKEKRNSRKEPVELQNGDKRFLLNQL